MPSLQKGDPVLLGPTAHSFVVDILAANGLRIDSPAIFGTYQGPVDETGALVSLPYPACAPEYVECEDDYVWAFNDSELYYLHAETPCPWCFSDYDEEISETDDQPEEPTAPLLEFTIPLADWNIDRVQEVRDALATATVGFVSHGGVEISHVDGRPFSIVNNLELFSIDWVPSPTPQAQGE